MNITIITSTEKINKKWITPKTKKREGKQREEGVKNKENAKDATPSVGPERHGGKRRCRRRDDGRLP